MRPPPAAVGQYSSARGQTPPAFIGVVEMNKFICILVLLATGNVAVATPAADLKPTRAVYAVSRDGKTVGDATYSLSSNPDGSWTLQSETKGSAGMARLVGLDVHEQSTFRRDNGKAQGQ